MIQCPKDVVVPVIFIPGIMGSRLRQKANPDKVMWDPDDVALMLKKYGLAGGFYINPLHFTGIGKAFENADMSVPGDHTLEGASVALSASARKKALIGGASFNKDYLEPMEYSDHENISNASDGFWGSQVERNWGSVAWSSYGSILEKLEQQFPQTLSLTVKEVNPEFNLVEMPVFALGYNWSASNDDSGKYAADKIKQWVAKAKQRAADIGAQCPGAIVLTHSMGGLVARSAAMIHGAAGDIFAVLHTVMPTDGAAAAYKRFHFGFEHPEFSIFSPIDGAFERAGYVVLGRQGQLVTAILGHMPGGQELLPNKRYKDNEGKAQWLTVKNPERNWAVKWFSDDEPFIELPKRNPYTEIYRREDRMYRAANPEWLFPEGMEDLPPTKSGFQYFSEVNKDAELFHDILVSSGDFHEVTYLCYSDDPGLKTYDRVDWESAKPFGSWGRDVSEKDVSADRTEDYRREGLLWGSEEDKEISGGWVGTDFKIAAPSGAGDMTVPASSGRFAAAVPKSRRTGHKSGYMHEPALKAGIVETWVKDTMVEVLGKCTLY
ncbi:triacylglycerol lipase [Thalassospira profundimaris]|nr:hypothetical protein [Thalassospira profundimaris]